MELGSFYVIGNKFLSKAKPLSALYAKARKKSPMPAEMTMITQAESELLELLESSRYGGFLGAPGLSEALKSGFVKTDGSNQMSAIGQDVAMTTAFTRHYKAFAEQESHDALALDKGRLDIKILNKESLANLPGTIQVLHDWNELLSTYSEIGPVHDGGHHTSLSYSGGSLVITLTVPVAIWAALVTVAGAIGAVFLQHVLSMSGTAKELKEARRTAEEARQLVAEIDEPKSPDLILERATAHSALLAQELKIRMLKKAIGDWDKEALEVQCSQLNDIVDEMMDSRTHEIRQGSNQHEVRNKIAAKSRYILHFLRAGNSLSYSLPRQLPKEVGDKDALKAGLQSLIELQLQDAPLELGEGKLKADESDPVG